MAGPTFIASKIGCRDQHAYVHHNWSLGRLTLWLCVAAFVTGMWGCTASKHGWILGRMEGRLVNTAGPRGKELLDITSAFDPDGIGVYLAQNGRPQYVVVQDQLHFDYYYVERDMVVRCERTSWGEIEAKCRLCGTVPERTRRLLEGIGDEPVIAELPIVGSCLNPNFGVQAVDRTDGEGSPGFIEFRVEDTSQPGNPLALSLSGREEDKSFGFVGADFVWFPLGYVAALRVSEEPGLHRYKFSFVMQEHSHNSTTITWTRYKLKEGILEVECKPGMITPVVVSFDSLDLTIATRLEPADESAE